MVRIVSVDETSGLLTKHLLVEMAMQESIGHVELVNWPGARDIKLENSVNCARFDNRGEGDREVHAGALAETAHHPSRLVAHKITIRTSLVAENPLANDNIGTGRPRDKLPRTVALQGIELFTHRSKPVQIPKGCAGGGGERRRGRGRRGTRVLV